MSSMTKKKPNTDPSGDSPKRSGKPLHAWIQAGLMDGLRKLAKKNRRSITAELEIALEQHLAEGGIEIPSDPDDSDD